MTDRASIRAIRQNDETGLAPIIDRYAAYVGSVIFNIIGESMTREDIEEATADVFITLWRNAEKPREGKLKAWLGAVARNKAKNKLRELCEALPLEDDCIADWFENPEWLVSEREERQIVRRAVARLRQPDREIFLRHYYGIQPVAQISSELGLSESAVKLRLMRGREKLRKILEEGGYLK
jgi:RNA polymerase sigma-70 factor (ECF subfamily)